MAIDPNIKEKTKYIRDEPSAMKVRDSIADGLDLMSEDVEATKQRQMTVEETFQMVIDETTDKDIISAPEIIAARGSHANLSQRLLSTDQQLAQTENSIPEITPELFGAIGDGIADDTAALQKMFDSKGKYITFPKGGKIYLITSQLSIDATKIKEINGNRSTILLNGDFIAFNVQGSLPVSGAAHPDSIGGAKNEHGMTINGFIFTAKDEISGTAILLNRVFGTLLTNNVFRFMKHGIAVDQKARNLIIAYNHAYALTGTALHFRENGDTHQVNIFGNHFSYCDMNIFAENHNLYNVQITGNDLESGLYKKHSTINIYLLSTTAKIEDIEISGNSLEDHWSTQCIVKMEAENPENILAVTISGNVIGNSNADEFIFRNIRNLTITGNSFKKSYGYSLKFLGRAEGVSITGNSFYSAGVINVYGSVFGFVFVGNVGYGLTKNPFIFSGDVSSDGFYSLNISDNAMHMAATASTLNNWLFEINIKILESLSVKGNTFRARPYVNNGMKITAADKIKKTIIRDNIVFDLPTGKTAYALPVTEANNVIVSDNI